MSEDERDLPVLGDQDVLELGRVLRERYRESLIAPDVYARTRMKALAVRAAAGGVTLTGLVSATVLAFVLGPELGALACVVVGCGSVFAPLLLANRVLKRIYREALRRSVVEGGASFAQPFAIPAGR